MMEVNSLKKIAILLIVCVATVMSGCDSDVRLLDTVPADAAAVVAVNAVRLNEELDGVRNGGKLTADETLDRLLVNSTDRAKKQIKTMLMSTAVDRNMVVAFAIHDKDGLRGVKEMIKSGVYILTFKINNVAELTEQLEAGARQTVGDFDAYSLDYTTLFVKGKQGWIMDGDPQRSAKLLSEQLTIASNKSIASLKGVGKFLERNDEVMRIAVAMTAANATGWTCVDTSFDNNSTEIDVDAIYLNADGDEVDMDTNLQKINSKLIDYTAPSDVFVAAMGLRSDTDWDAILGYVQDVYPLDYKQRTLMGLILPYLRRIDGTIMVAAGPMADATMSAGDIENQISFVVAIEMSKENIKKTMSDINGLISTMGLSALRDGKTIVWQVAGSPAITLTAEGNCLVFANRSLKQLGNDAARDCMKGNVVTVWANIPDSMGEVTYGGRGFSIDMEVSDDFSSRFRFNGSSAPILEQLAMLLQDDDDVNVVDDDDYDSLGFTPIDTIK